MRQNGSARTRRAALEMAMSIARFTTLLKPCSGTSLMLMTGMPSRSSSRARSAITCRRSGDENPLEADAGAPSPFEDLAHQLARRVSERHVQSEEDAPDQLRHFEDTLFLRRIRREVGLDVQRGDDAEHDGEDAADEDREEIVDA